MKKKIGFGLVLCLLFSCLYGLSNAAVAATCEHRYRGTFTQRPTCTQCGYKVEKCFMCNKELGARGNIVNSLGHTYHLNTKVDDSKTKIIVSCDRCGCEKSNQPESWAVFVKYDNGKLRRSGESVEEGRMRLWVSYVYGDMIDVEALKKASLDSFIQKPGCNTSEAATFVADLYKFTQKVPENKNLKSFYDKIVEDIAEYAYNTIVNKVKAGITTKLSKTVPEVAVLAEIVPHTKICASVIEATEKAILAWRNTGIGFTYKAYIAELYNWNNLTFHQLVTNYDSILNEYVGSLRSDELTRKERKKLFDELVYSRMCDEFSTYFVLPRGYKSIREYLEKQR